MVGTAHKKFLSHSKVTACNLNVKSTDIMKPFQLQDEVVNLACIMRFDDQHGIERVHGFDPRTPPKDDRKNKSRRQYEAVYFNKFKAMIYGTVRGRVKGLSDDQVRGRVRAAVALMRCPRTLSALITLPRRALPEFFAATHGQAWITMRSGKWTSSRILYLVLASATLLYCFGCRERTRRLTKAGTDKGSNDYRHATLHFRRHRRSRELSKREE